MKVYTICVGTSAQVQRGWKSSMEKSRQMKRHLREEEEEEKKNIQEKTRQANKKSEGGRCLSEQNECMVKMKTLQRTGENRAPSSTSNNNNNTTANSYSPLLSFTLLVSETEIQKQGERKKERREDEDGDQALLPLNKATKMFYGLCADI